MGQDASKLKHRTEYINKSILKCAVEDASRCLENASDAAAKVCVVKGSFQAMHRKVLSVRHEMMSENSLTLDATDSLPSLYKA